MEPSKTERYRFRAREDSKKLQQHFLVKRFIEPGVLRYYWQQNEFIHDYYICNKIKKIKKKLTFFG